MIAASSCRGRSRPSSPQRRKRVVRRRTGLHGPLLPHGHRARSLDSDERSLGPRGHGRASRTNRARQSAAQRHRRELDDEQCLALADAADRKTASGDPLPPLHGLPTAFKDLQSQSASRARRAARWSTKTRADRGSPCSSSGARRRRALDRHDADRGRQRSRRLAAQSRQLQQHRRLSAQRRPHADLAHVVSAARLRGQRAARAHRRRNRVADERHDRARPARSVLASGRSGRVSRPTRTRLSRHARRLVPGFGRAAARPPRARRARCAAQDVRGLGLRRRGGRARISPTPTRCS